MYKKKPPFRLFCEKVLKSNHSFVGIEPYWEETHLVIFYCEVDAKAMEISNIQLISY